MQTRNARIGLIMFVIYTGFYSGFVFLNAFYPKLMEITPIGGINLAILYGMVLILAAFVMSLIYGYLCRTNETPSSGETHS
ncbi:MAG: DUF485 domain-containing protein [Planctomycetota bacterium]|nr:DUF485 domain-containing protein [Planctomycetota bacterium]